MRGPRSRLGPDQVDEMVRLREHGWGVERLAARYGVSRGLIGWLCLREGADPPNPLPLRPPPTAPVEMRRGNHVVRLYTAAEDARLLALEAEGLTVTEIARRLGRSRHSVLARLMTLARHAERQRETTP